MNVELADRVRLVRAVPIAALVALGLPVALRAALRAEVTCPSGTMLCVPWSQIVAMLVLTIALGALAGLIAQDKPGLVGVGVGSVIGSWAIWTSRDPGDPVVIVLIAGITFVPLAVGYATTRAVFRSTRATDKSGTTDG